MYFVMNFAQVNAKNNFIFIYINHIGSPPFETKSYNGTYDRIKKVDLKFPDYLSDDVKDFLRKILVYDKTKRLPLDKIISHPWITKYNKENM